MLDYISPIISFTLTYATMTPNILLIIVTSLRLSLNTIQTVISIDKDAKRLH